MRKVRSFSSIQMLLRIVVFAIFVTFTVSSNEQPEISACLKKCLTPLAKLERTFSYIFNNFERVCDLLEDQAFCARKCDRNDQSKFYQFTTFYRLHCVDYEEELQSHIPCISLAAKEADGVCRDKCKAAHKVEKTASKETKMKKDCLTFECSTICYYDELVEACPEAKDVLLKVNVGQVHSMANTIHPVNIDQMVQECRNLHDTNYMRAKFLTSSTSLLVDHTPTEIESEQRPVITV